VIHTAGRGAGVPGRPCEDAHMPRAVRLVSFTDLGPTAAPEHVNISVLLTAEIDDGRGITLLDDRGWTMEPDGPDAWDSLTEEDVTTTARVVVGPDEPPPGRSPEQEHELHWDEMARRLREQGVSADGAELRRLPHDVVIGVALRARIGPGAS
jgi:hypothetical protein